MSRQELEKAPAGKTRVVKTAMAYPASSTKTYDFEKPYVAINRAKEMYGYGSHGIWSFDVKVFDDQGKCLWSNGEIKIPKSSLAEVRAKWARDQALLSAPSILTSPLDVLCLPHRIQMCLEAENIYSVDALIRTHRIVVLKFHRIGKKSVGIIQEALKIQGFELGMELDVDRQHKKSSDWHY